MSTFILIKRNCAGIIMLATWLIVFLSSILITAFTYYFLINHSGLNNAKFDRIHYAVVILSDFEYEETRNHIRETWFNLAKNIYVIDNMIFYEWRLLPNGTVNSKYVNVTQFNKVNIKSRRIKHNTTRNEHSLDEDAQNIIGFYFAIGVRQLSRTELIKLQLENLKYNDLLLLDKVDDRYESLPAKVMYSISWIHRNLKNVRYLVKCDDDSFVRIDLIVRDLVLYAPLMKAPVLREYITFKDNRLIYNGLYWGYFVGNTFPQREGKWYEHNWFLCDRYLPYALGGGYVISKSIIDFIATNAEHLSMYNCEDTSMGVWTAGLNVKRVHDIRFESGHLAKRCDRNAFVRHKQSGGEIRELYNRLVLDQGRSLCSVEFVGRSYLYSWSNPPSLCCAALLW